MKVLFNCHTPFMLAHGGEQIQIQQTMAALAKEGVEVEALRWWDDKQSGDVLHHFGRVPTNVVRLAMEKGIAVVMSELLTEHGSRSPLRHLFHKMMVRVMRRALPKSLTTAFAWDAYQLADACVALTPLEADLMRNVFGAPAERVHVVPNGVEDVFFESQRVERGKWLVCTATIVERKRVVELTGAAIRAQTPVWVIGKPYSENDPYATRFFELARQHSGIVRYEGPIADRQTLARIYREARGFVLLSRMESLSLSALEASACECPLLLSDLPWARNYFKEDARYCPVASEETMARYLREFYDAAPGLKPPPKPKNWADVAQQLEGIYGRVTNAK